MIKKYKPKLYEYEVLYYELVPVTKVVKAIHTHNAYEKIKATAQNLSEKEPCIVTPKDTKELKVDFHEDSSFCGDDEQGVCACCGRYDEEDDYEECSRCGF